MAVDSMRFDRPNGLTCCHGVTHYQGAYQQHSFIISRTLEVLNSRFHATDLHCKKIALHFLVISREAWRYRFKADPARNRRQPRLYFAGIHFR